MDIILWILQVLLAIVFLGIGFSHAFRFDQMAAQRQTSWMLAVGRQQMRAIGILEVLGAMVFAIVFHARRSGEGANIVFNAVLGIVALAVAVGRFVIVPLS